MARPAESRGTIAAAFVRQALQAVARRGLDPALALEKAGLAADLLDDELFGLDSRPMRVGSFATLCHLMLHTPDLRTALVRGARLVNLLLADTRVELDLEGPEAALRFVEQGPRAREAQVFAHETLFVMLHGLVCWLVRRRIVIHEAEFSYPPPAWQDEYLLIVGETLHFQRPVTRFAFSAADLDAPVVQTEASAREFLRGAPHNFLLKYKDPQSVAHRVRRLLRETPPEQWPDFDELAWQLRRHPTTLRRRLEEEGSSYRIEKSARRRDLALEYLADPRRSVLDVAQALGFAEPSAFHRAFRQWTGMSPGEYRKKAGLKG